MNEIQLQDQTLDSRRQLTRKLRGESIMSSKSRKHHWECSKWSTQSFWKVHRKAAPAAHWFHWRQCLQNCSDPMCCFLFLVAWTGSFGQNQS